MIFLHGGGPCVIEVAAVAPALPFIVTAYFALRYHLSGRAKKESL